MDLSNKLPENAVYAWSHTFKICQLTSDKSFRFPLTLAEDLSVKAQAKLMGIMPRPPPNLWDFRLWSLGSEVSKSLDVRNLASIEGFIVEITGAEKCSDEQEDRNTFKFITIFSGLFE